MGNPRTAKRDEAAAIMRAVDAWRLYLDNRTEREIAKELGVSPSTVHKYISRGRQRYLDSIQGQAESRHDEHFARLARLRETASEHYRITADLSALELVRKCEADIRKLFGDDAPEKKDVKIDAGVAFLPPEQMYAEVMDSLKKLEAQ